MIRKTYLKGTMKLSQLNQRFHKKLIEALKVRAGRENISVTALAERFLDNGLKTVAPGDGYFQLVADPEATVRQLYRYIILGQTFGTAPVSRDELRFILAYVREAFMRGRNRIAMASAMLPYSWHSLFRLLGEKEASLSCEVNVLRQ